MKPTGPKYSALVECPQQPDSIATMRADHESSLAAREFRIMRDAFGMSAQDLADYLGVGLRTVQRMSAKNAGNVDKFRETLMLQLDLETRQWHTFLVQHGDELSTPVTVHSRGGWRQLEINKRWVPESWWAMIIGRALLENSGINWEYVYD